MKAPKFAKIDVGPVEVGARSRIMGNDTSWMSEPLHQWRQIMVR